MHTLNVFQWLWYKSIEEIMKAVDNNDRHKGTVQDWTQAFLGIVCFAFYLMKYVAIYNYGSSFSAICSKTMQNIEASELFYLYNTQEL